MTDEAPITPARFALTVLAASAVNLVLHGLAYYLFLGDFYRAHPSGPEEFVRHLNRADEGLVGWAMALTTVSMGLFVTVMMRWAGARDAREGLRRGVILGSLFWVAVNSALYASSNLFSLAAVLVDTPISAACMAASASVAAWMLRRP